jgi:MFS family permease
VPLDGDSAGGFRLLINLAHALTHYALLILPTAVLAMTQPGASFATDYGSTIVLATGMFALYGAAALPQSWLAARFGKHRLITVFHLGLGGALIAAGATSSAGVFALALSVAGLFAAIYHPVGTALLVERAGPRPGVVLGVNGVFGNLGVALAPMLTGLLAGVSWRLAFIVPGLVLVALGLCWLGRASSEPPGSPRPPSAGRGAAVSREAKILLVMAVASGLLFNAYTILIPKLVEERSGLALTSLVGVGALGFGITVCGALAQLAVGRMLDRVRLKAMFLAMTVLTVATLLLISFVPGHLSLAFAALASAAIFGQVLVNEAITASRVPAEVRLRIYSLRFFLSFVGSTAAAPLVGAVYDRTGSTGAVSLLLTAAAAVMVACAGLFPDEESASVPTARPA